MAIANWLKINGNTTTLNGAANGTFTIVAQPNTGRNSRTSSVTVAGDGVSKDKSVSITQSGKEGFITIYDGQAAIAKEGGSVTITGVSNAKSLKFEWVNVENETEPDYDVDNNVTDPVTKNDYPDATIATQYTAAGVTQNNGTNISGDPGGSAQYGWSTKITFPSNPHPKVLYRKLKISDTNDSSVTASIIFEQAHTPAFINVSPSNYTFEAAGGSTTITVTSNTTWTVS